MILEIKKVKRCRKNVYGNFTITKKGKATIRISLAKNKYLADYSTTLLHELMHCYAALLRVEGFKMSLKTEHYWIEACETVISELLVKLFKKEK